MKVVFVLLAGFMSVAEDQSEWRFHNDSFLPFHNSIQLSFDYPI